MLLALAGHVTITASHFWILRELERRKEEHAVQRAHSPTGHRMR